MIELENGKAQSIDLFKQQTESTLKTTTSKFETNINPDEFPQDFLELKLDSNIMLKIVTGAMYENPLIPFQEITCNGRDAIIRKIKSGYLNFIPKIKIQIDYDKLEASISDNGIGMSWETIENIYCYIGRSDKRNTLSEMGKWGVGAKTPFAMSSTYHVKSTSFETHETLEFLVTDKGIMKEIQRPQLPNEESGTTITFPLSQEYKYKPEKIREYLRTRVENWNLSVEYTETSFSNVKLPTRLLSRTNTYPRSPEKFTTQEIIDTATCTYPISLIKTNKGFSYAFFDPCYNTYNTYNSYNPSNSQSSSISIEGIKYPLKYTSPTQIFVVLDDLSLINTSATREKLSHDFSYSNFLELLDSEIISHFKNRFKTLFCNPTLKVPKITNLDITWYAYLLSKNLIASTDYPFYDILSKKYTIYTPSCASTPNPKKNSNLLYLNELEDYSEVFYIPTITSSRLKSYFKLFPNNAIIKLPTLCLKDCITCKNFAKNSTKPYNPFKPNTYKSSKTLTPEYSCTKDFSKSHIIQKYFKPLPKFRVFHKFSKPTAFRAVFANTGSTRNIQYNTTNKTLYKILRTNPHSHKYFPLNDVLEVSPKKYEELKESGWNCFDNEPSLKSHCRKHASIVLNNKSYTFSEISQYDCIIKISNYYTPSEIQEIQNLIKKYLNINALFVSNSNNLNHIQYITDIQQFSWSSFIASLPANTNFKVTYEVTTSFHDYLSRHDKPSITAKFHYKIKPQLSARIFDNF